MKKVEFEIKSCLECPYHRVIPDPDYDDWFNDDDEAIVCTKLRNDQKGKYSNSCAYNQEYKVVASMLRPHETRKFEYIPDFCPEWQDC